MTKYNTLLLEVDNKIGILTINRPKSMNALNSELLTELEKVAEEIEKNEAIDVVILTGAGEKAFVAGADIKEMAEKNSRRGPDFLKTWEYCVQKNLEFETTCNCSC